MTTEKHPKPSASGLDGYVFAETTLSHVDGERGQLVISGRDIEHVAGEITFATLAAELWKVDRTPHESERVLAAWRVKLYPQLVTIPGAPSNGMDFLRAAVGSLDSEAFSADDEREAVTAATAVAAAIWSRRRRGLEPLVPDATLSHAADYLRMVTGIAPDPTKAAALDAYFVTVSDHGMNASTFAARVVASTGSDMVSAVTAGIGALKGPLHGGAPGPVLDMLDAIGSPAAARDWLDAELAAGKRIMGMGHRIYRVRDPRAAVLEKQVERLERSGMKTVRLTLARAVESAAASLLKERYPTRPLQANVEFYTAVLLDAVGLPRELFSPTFAVARVAGWCAHVTEQRTCGRLIRPDSKYIGPMP